MKEEIIKRRGGRAESGPICDVVEGILNSYLGRMVTSALATEIHDVIYNRTGRLSIRQ
jgi:hypothetical protein